MAIQPINKGVVLTVKTERYTTKSRATESDFRFNSAFDKQLLTNERLAPNGTLVIKNPGLCKLLIIRSAGKLTLAGTLNGSAITIPLGPLTVLSDATFSTDVTITNTDAVGTAAKDVAVEAYIDTP